MQYVLEYVCLSTTSSVTPHGHLKGAETTRARIMNAAPTDREGGRDRGREREKKRKTEIQTGKAEKRQSMTIMKGVHVRPMRRLSYHDNECIHTSKHLLVH
mmetsp:Transcript_39772/g.78391  ORF Transcript_39772/g.78391 Transcript_39772/m.78391 type:complete len:101 (-) Transcript_39772:1304-1606(-)